MAFIETYLSHKSTHVMGETCHLPKGQNIPSYRKTGEVTDGNFEKEQIENQSSFCLNLMAIRFQI